MKPWRDVVVPHKDIRDGHFDESTFAASLSDVVNRRGPLEYQDAGSFFRKTYPTQGLVRLLAAVVGRLAGSGPGEPVIQIQTPFGGGKTHALVALYHLFKSADSLRATDVVKQVLKESRASAVPSARVVTFDGLVADPLGRTPWGELAAQVGRYDLVREHDQRHRSPGKDILYTLLADSPTLFLMDEVAEFAAKAKDYQEQVMAFFQELTETVKVLPHCALVVTLPSSAPYGEEGERALRQLETIFGRVEAIYSPVEGEEVFEVIRRRLFEDVGDPEEARLVAESYWQMYQRLGDDVPAEARQPAYRDRIRLAYPFHPQVIDLLYERWSTFATFQRTRGVLRLLANVVLDLYRREHPAPLIQVAHVNLANPDIRREFIKHIGNAYEGVVATDIVDSNAKAQRIDREMGSEYARFHVASGLATAIFFSSFSGSERRGANAPALRLAFLREGIPSAIVGDALGRLEDELWFLHVEGGLYQFRNQPNLNRVILEREEAVNETEVEAEIRTRLDRLVGAEMRVTLFPNGPGDIPDNRELKLAVLRGERVARNPATLSFVEDLLNKTSSAFRTYRNTLLILVPDAGEFNSLRHQVKRYLALKSIQEDKALLRTLSEDNRDTLTARLKDTGGTIDFQLLSVYRHLAKASSEGVEWLDLGLPTTGERGSLARRVREFLRSQDLLLERLAPRHILEKAMGRDDKEKPLSEVYEAFLRYPHLPILESESVLWQAVARGVREGTFGVRAGDRTYFREPVPEHVLQGDAVLVREAAGSEGDRGDNGGVGPPPPPPPPVTQLHFRVRLSAERMSDFVKGVLLPLKMDGARVDVEIQVTAESAGGIKKSTLEQKVKETLRQIGAEVLEERVE